MPGTLCITARFLSRHSHGRGEDGGPEWPPSPLRLFQAMVASAVGRPADEERKAQAIGALRWLERQPAPEIVAPAARPAQAGYRLYVPNNVGDIVAKVWSAGRETSLAYYRTEKDVRPMHLDGEAVHYVFAGVDGLGAHLSTLRVAARSMSHLGWGIDQVVGDACEDVGSIVGERWHPGRGGGIVLRRPVPGTLEALERRYARFLGRLEGGIFRPVPALAVFENEPYARSTDQSRRPFAAFRLVEPLTGDRLWLDAARRVRDVAAWTRHAVAEASAGWPFGPTGSLIHGHVEVDGVARPRISFLPLPTINPRLSRVEGVTRIAVVGALGHALQIDWLRPRLSGRELEWKGAPVAMLEPLPADDWVLSRYVDFGDEWSTVTPVVLPGHDDRSPAKAERLLRKAFRQAGFDPEIVDGIRELEWRKVGFRAGTEHANRYLPPDKVNGPMFHVRVRFGSVVAGPVAVGSGRHRGIGVFARE